MLLGRIKLPRGRRSNHGEQNDGRDVRALVRLRVWRTARRGARRIRSRAGGEPRVARRARPTRSVGRVGARVRTGRANRVVASEPRRAARGGGEAWRGASGPASPAAQAHAVVHAPRAASRRCRGLGDRGLPRARKRDAQGSQQQRAGRELGAHARVEREHRLQEHDGFLGLHGCARGDASTWRAVQGSIHLGRWR